MNQARNDFDSPWKEALEKFLRPFLALCFPAVEAQIDWSREVVFLDKELQALEPDTEARRQFVNKLVRVFLRDVGEATATPCTSCSGSWIGSCRCRRPRNTPFVTSFERFARQEGLHAGQIEALKEAIRDVLTARFDQVPPELDVRLESCTDPGQLRRWHRQAVTAPDLATVSQHLD